jgi:hypothetical protein
MAAPVVGVICASCCHTMCVNICVRERDDVGAQVDEPSRDRSEFDAVEVFGEHDELLTYFAKIRRGRQRWVALPMQIHDHYDSEHGGHE